MGHEVQSKLYVVAAAGADPQQLAAMLDAAGAATLLIAAGEAARAYGCVRRARSSSWRRHKDIAALIEGDAQLARTLRADGVHLPWSKDVAARYGEAREVLGTRYIVGVDVGRSRHDAMTLAEDGADYIGFGIPPHVEDRAAAAARRLELVSWWSEIFEVPCVAFDVDTAEDAIALARRGRRLRRHALRRRSDDRRRQRRWRTRSPKPRSSARRWHERSAAPCCSLLGALALAHPAAAETSSWVMETTEAPKPKRGKPVKLAPAPSAAKAPTFKGPATAGQSAYAKSLAPPTGDEAAYIAFDQGQYLTALKLAEEGVKRNDPQSHTLLGRLYAEGLGVSKEPQTAAKWYARGDELGDIQATFALGVLYAEGRGVKKDRAKSAELFEKAARTGHPLANYNLGLLFLKGDGKPQNPYRAAMHIRYAAEKGIAVAQYDLAGLYQNGAGVEPNALDAARWLSKAAEQGMAEAQFDYAVVLLRGLGLTQG